MCITINLYKFYSYFFKLNSFNLKKINQTIILENQATKEYNYLKRVKCQHDMRLALVTLERLPLSIVEQ